MESCLNMSYKGIGLSDCHHSYDYRLAVYACRYEPGLTFFKGFHSLLGFFLLYNILFSKISYFLFPLALKPLASFHLMCFLSNFSFLCLVANILFNQEHFFIIHDASLTLETDLKYRADKCLLTF